MDEQKASSVGKSLGSRAQPTGTVANFSSCVQDEYTYGDFAGNLQCTARCFGSRYEVVNTSLLTVVPKVSLDSEYSLSQTLDVRLELLARLLLNAGLVYPSFLHTEFPLDIICLTSMSGLTLFLALCLHVVLTTFLLTLTIGAEAGEGTLLRVIGSSPTPLFGVLLRK